MKLYSVELPYVDSAALFYKVSDEHWAIFLDSGVIDGKPPTSRHANYDVLAIRPHSTLVFDGGFSYFQKGETHHKLPGDPIALLQAIIPELDDPEDNQFAYVPGALGYFSYDLARQYETLPTLALNDENLPEMAMGIYHVIVLVDHQEKKTRLLHLGEDEQVLALRTFWSELIEHTADFSDMFEDIGMQRDYLTKTNSQENLTREDYERCFKQIRKYTVEGDCYQVNMAKRFSAEVDGDSWYTYQKLRSLSPAPYASFINLPFAQVLSNSPESFIECIAGNVVTSPIKGTRGRDLEDPENDKRIAESLFQSNKDRAENLMIVDLMRNDLSRCCELGSVRVPTLFSVHTFANVHHLISTVKGRLKPELHSLDLLRSCFPGGSITGAPKIRAMEIIEELEPHRRGLYCGSIGYIGANGDLQTNIAIRTIVVKGGVARYSAGGGLVIDSDVDEEYQEIIDKASVMNKVLELNLETKPEKAPEPSFDFDFELSLD